MRNINRLWVLIMAIGLLITACGERSEQVEESIPVLLDPTSTSETENTIPVARMDLYAGDYIGVSVVLETVEIRFGMEGEVVSIDVLAGREVEEGQVLATLNQRNLLDTIDTMQEELAYSESNYSLQLKQAELEIQIAQKQLEQLQVEYEVQEQRKREEAAKKEEEARKKEEAEAAAQKSVIEENSDIDLDSDITEESTAPEPSDQPEKPEEEIQIPEIKQVDIQLASLSLEEAELMYSQLLEEYNLEMTQRQEELQALLDQVGEDTLTAPFSGRVIEIYYAVGSYVTEDDVIMLIINEDKKDAAR